MRNLLITSDYPPNTGGVARYLESLVLTFPQAFRVWSTVSGAQTAPQPLFWKLWPRWFPTVIACIHFSRTYDRLFVSHVLPFGVAVWLASFVTRRPYVVIFHGLDWRLTRRSVWKRWLTNRVLHRADRVVCNSQALAIEVRKTEVCHPIVIYPTPSREFLDRMSTQEKRASDSLHLLTVARLVRRKNHLAILEAVAQLPNVQYTIIGDGPERSSIAQAIARLHLTNRVHLLTQVSNEELPAMYASADVFILPTLPDPVDVEGFGIVYIEAAVSGLPIIATALLGVKEALCSEGSIQLEDPTPQAIKEALQTLEDEQRRAWMGQANQAFARRFSPDRQFHLLASYV